MYVLTKEVALDMYESGVSLVEIGKPHNLRPGQVLGIINGTFNLPDIKKIPNPRQCAFSDKAGNSQLTDDQAKEIREAVILHKESISNIITNYKIKRNVALDIISGRRYRSAGGPIRRLEPTYMDGKRPSPEFHREVHRRWDDGELAAHIAKAMGSSVKYVTRLAGTKVLEDCK